MRGMALAAWLLAACWALLYVSAVDGDRVTIALATDASVHRVNGAQWTTAADSEISIRHNKTNSEHGDVFLVIGIKTNVLKGAATRAAIRDTWGRAEATHSLGVRVWFVGCSPDLSGISEPDRASAMESIALEKAAYEDLLTHELKCEDSIAALVDKTIEFMHFADTTSSPTSAFIMMTDDDVYLRLDRLAALLRSDALPRERLYAGNAATETQRAPNAPNRDPRSRFYVSHYAYPMTELPPFISGAHYLLSRDMAEFIARNREDIRGLDGLDDITMALWMLALQVHPTFLDSFQMIQHAPCSEDLVSYAGLSPTGIHQIHSNVISGRALCDAFSEEMWRKVEMTEFSSQRSEEASELEESMVFEWDILHDPASALLHIQVGCIVDTKRATLLYVPSAGSYDALFCGQLLDTLRVRLSLILSPSICVRHRRLLQEFIAQQIVSIPSLRAKLEIARHNLARSETDDALGIVSPVWTVAVSPGAAYSRVVFECLFTRLFPSHHVAVLNEADLMPHAPPPDVFVFSVLDNGIRTASDKPQAHLPPTGAAFVSKYGRTSRLVMISGESWRPNQLHPHVTLLSTVETPPHTKHVYFPYAAATFGEIVRHTPMTLLEPRAIKVKTEDRRFCAYMYSNCAVGIRERMFDLVNAIEQTDALGHCQGASRAPNARKRVGRSSAFYSDDAIDMYRNYKFVISFENTFTSPGYVTEKIVTALLAGAVPIYYGNSESVSRLFNHEAFIDCGAFVSLEACAARVQQVHHSPSEYETMRAAAPVTNRTAFYEFFSWHPAVAELAEADNHPREATVAAQLEALMSANR